jgi:hypothetical protein
MGRHGQHVPAIGIHRVQDRPRRRTLIHVQRRDGRSPATQSLTHLRQVLASFRPLLLHVLLVRLRRVGDVGRLHLNPHPDHPLQNHGKPQRLRQLQRRIQHRFRQLRAVQRHHHPVQGQRNRQVHPLPLDGSYHQNRHVQVTDEAVRYAPQPGPLHGAAAMRRHHHQVRSARFHARPDGVVRPPLHQHHLRVHLRGLAQTTGRVTKIRGPLVAQALAQLRRRHGYGTQGVGVDGDAQRRCFRRAGTGWGQGIVRGDQLHGRPRSSTQRRRQGEGRFRELRSVQRYKDS